MAGNDAKCQEKIEKRERRKDRGLTLAPMASPSSIFSGHKHGMQQKSSVVESPGETWVPFYRES